MVEPVVHVSAYRRRDSRFFIHSSLPRDTLAALCSVPRLSPPPPLHIPFSAFVGRCNDQNERRLTRWCLAPRQHRQSAPPLPLGAPLLEHPSHAHTQCGHLSPSNAEYSQTDQRPSYRFEPRTLTLCHGPSYRARNLEPVTTPPLRNLSPRLSPSPVQHTNPQYRMHMLPVCIIHMQCTPRRATRIQIAQTCTSQQYVTHSA